VPWAGEGWEGVSGAAEARGGLERKWGFYDGGEGQSGFLNGVIVITVHLTCQRTIEVLIFTTLALDDSELQELNQNKR